MILHRRVHKMKIDGFAEGLALALEFNRIASEKLGNHGKVYHPSMLGSRLSRRHVVVDTYHDSLRAMEEYYSAFRDLPEVKKLAPRWFDVVEEGWAENFVVVEP
jgi:hypothetical protein